MEAEQKSTTEVTTMKRRIMWRPCDWFANHDESLHNEDMDTDIDEDEDEDAQEEGMKLRVETLVQTPFGIAKYNDKMSPTYDTEFVIGHTNFNIDKSVFDAIEKADGVEFLKVMSRYRFIIGAGRMFDMNDVRHTIETSLKANHRTTVESKQAEKVTSQEEIPSALQAIAEQISTKYQNEKFWAAYIFPNGQFVSKVYESQEKLDEEKNELFEMKKASNGIVITST